MGDGRVGDASSQSAELDGLHYQTGFFGSAPEGGEELRVEPKTTRREILEDFDKNVTAARAALAGASDEELLKPWTLLKGGVTLMTLPKIAVLRSFVMNHIIHHRGQFTVYLRLNEIPVPSIYGPSADEGAM